MARYPRIPEGLKRQLQRVASSRDGRLEYYPCAVTLDDGGELECVYIADFDAYIRIWGVGPDVDSGKRSISIDHVASIRESPFRMPAKLADQLLEAGKSGMGYCIFTVAFSNGVRQAYLTGGACRLHFASGGSEGLGCLQGVSPRRPGPPSPQ